MPPFVRLKPTRIEETSPLEMKIDWADGRTTRHVYRNLRLACQCAQCREEMTGRPLIDPARIPADVHPKQINPVGGYAIQIQWSDGHDTGIFPYSGLRELDDSAANAPPENTP